MGYEAIVSSEEARARRRGSAALVAGFVVVLGALTVFHDGALDTVLGLFSESGPGTDGGANMASTFGATVALSQPYDKNVLCYLAEVDVTRWPSAAADAAKVAVSYAPVDSEAGLWIWSEAADVSVSQRSASITFCRLRLKTAHSVRVYLRSGAKTHLLSSARVTTAGLGHVELDEGPFAEVTGAKPSFPLVTVQHIVGDETTTKWFGLLALDQEGYIVWYHAGAGTGRDVGQLQTRLLSRSFSTRFG